MSDAEERARVFVWCFFELKEGEYFLNFCSLLIVIKNKRFKRQEKHLYLWQI